MEKDIKKKGFYISSTEERAETIFAEGAFKELVEDFLGRNDILFMITGIDFLAVVIERDGFNDADYLLETNILIDKLKELAISVEVEGIENKCITRVDFGDVAFNYSKSGAYLGIPYQVIKILYDYSKSH